MLYFCTIIYVGEKKSDLEVILEIFQPVSMKEPSLHVNNRKIKVRGKCAFISISPKSNVFSSQEAKNEKQA